MRSNKLTRNSQMLYVFGTNFTILFIGMGLFPVLPLVAADLGAPPALVGVFLALTYASITFGTMAFSWLAARFPHRALLAAAGAAGIPSLFLMGHVTALWQLAALTGIVWFAGGVGLSLVSVLTGLMAEKAHRGASFSLMSLAMPLAAVVGGFAVSQLIATGGYTTMFTVVSATWVLIPLLAWRMDKRVLPGRSEPSSPRPARAPRMSGTFYAFATVMLISTAAVNIGRLGTSLSMRGLDFSPSEVASTSTISGLVTIPIMLLLGRLSDRLSRRHVLAVTYVLIVWAVVMLVVATQIWHFWLAATLLLIGRVVNGAVGAAFVTDILTPAELIRGLSRLNTVSWAAGVATFAIGGYLLGSLGASVVYLSAAAFAIIAMIQVEVLGSGYRPPEAVRSAVEDIKQATQTQLAVVAVDARVTCT